MRYTKNILLTGIALLFLAVPSTLAQGTAEGVTGITLGVVPNAVDVQWSAPNGVAVDHYTIYYADQSIVGNNGRFKDKEVTAGDETALVLFDLRNRGFRDGDMLFVTVTYTVGAEENMVFSEEKSIPVKIPGGGHGAAPSAATLENALSESLTSIRLHFSLPVRISLDASQSFSITEESTGNPVTILSAVSDGPDVTLTTLPMIARARYTISISETVVDATGAVIDPTKREATFVARGSVEPETESMPAQGGSALGEEMIVPQLLEIPPARDETPPEPPQDLILRKIPGRNGLYRIEASWQESLNTAADLQSYNVYESSNRGQSFAGPTALRATVTSTTIANVPPGTLTVKLTAMDHAGNESSGIQKTILLPETGPALTLLLSLAGAGLWAGRRKKYAWSLR